MSALKNLACQFVVLTFFASTALSAEQVDEGPRNLDRAVTLYRQGNFVGALSIIRPLATSGDARAETYLAKMLLSGQGVQRDAPAGLALLRAAADQDYREAEFLLGAAYASGEPGLPVDYVEALKWLIIARAQDGLAYSMLRDQMGAENVATATARAARWREDTDRRKVQAALALGNKNEVSDHLTRLADEGLPAAQYELGLLYAAGVPDGIPSKKVPGLMDFLPNDRKAAELFLRAASLGYPPAQSRFGSILYEGRGVTADKAEAAKWFEKAAAQSEVSAMIALADMLAAGDGVRQDQGRAFTLYSHAAGKGDPAAMKALGESYASGKLTERDTKLAYMWLTLASQIYRKELVEVSAKEADLTRLGLVELMSQDEIDRAKNATDMCLSTHYQQCGASSLQ
ncbi:tetratricopeptide repeat protein [Mesorhizobium sp. M4A.F.Ca.ET.050.02.1.1]|uniref:tetratricopeptide repeat protein n=1 Tax=Mesorhizobium sp. M4A.F.Ca.ET.050.02.1.1 TaxID=2496754 RepID=UPI00167F1548|nr:tetratricopeptide repeat protein [Mesorhizobium sp. M4A.F.Ca.ET.050.02.1.1]